MLPNRLAACFRLLPALALALSPASAAAAGGDAISAKKYFAGSEFPLAEQRRLAARLLGARWLRDNEAEEYLQRVSRRLAPADKHFIVIADTDAVNAFAYLGGIMVIYRGLWQFAEEEDGFVGVVAHEMGHVKLDHVRKAYRNAQRTAALALPLLTAGLLIDDPQARQAVVAGGAGAIGSSLFAYSRELEHEADIYALDAMLSASRDAQAMARLFSRFGGGGNEYLSTHPAPSRRGAYLSSRLHSSATPASMEGLDYYLLREKLSRRKVVERDYQKRKRAILASDADETEKIIARYGLLLSAGKMRDYKLGAEMTAALAAQDNPIVARARAASMSQRGKNKEALDILAKLHEKHPQRASLLLEMFSVLERLEQQRKILAMFDALPAALREHPDILHAAGRAAASLKKPLLSNYLLAHSQAQSGNFEQAQRQIAIAEKFKGETETLVQLARLSKRVSRELRLLREKRVLEIN